MGEVSWNRNVMMEKRKKGSTRKTKNPTRNNKRKLPQLKEETAGGNKKSAKLESLEKNPFEN